MRVFMLLASLLVSGSNAFAEPRIEVGLRDGVALAQQIVSDNGTIGNDARANSRLIFLNRGGVTLYPGTSDARNNRSSLIQAQASIPPWNASPELWSETVTCLREIYAPFDVGFTETDPGDVPHIEAVFGGSASMLSLPARAGGVAPFSTGCKVIENSIVFAFTDVLPESSKVICEVMAQEIAHSYGLDHVLLAPDPMTYLSYAGKRSFQDTSAECGELSPRPCGVPGYTSCRARQNSYELLAQRLGEAGLDGTDAAGNIEGPETDVGCSVAPGPGWLAGLLLVFGRRRRVRSRRSR